MNYYSLEKVNNTLDSNGEIPLLILISNNRSAGKTTAVLKEFLEKFIEQKWKFCILYRHKYEITSADKIFDDIMKREYPTKEITIKTHAQGSFCELFLDSESCGFSIPMSNPDTLKKYSPMFGEVRHGLLDEFQTESGQYLPKEVEKFLSIYMTISRGGGEQSRPVKMYLLSNPVSIMNPYYIRLGIHKRILPNTKMIRGENFICELGFNESARTAIKNNGVIKALGGAFVEYSVGEKYMIDVNGFIEKHPKGKTKYLFTILWDNYQIGIRENAYENYVHASNKIDESCKSKFVLKVANHKENTIMIGNYSPIIQMLKVAFEENCLRFDSVETKNVMFDILAISFYK